MPLFLEIVSEDQLVRVAELNEGLARRGRVVVIRVALEGGAVERILRLLLASRPSQPQLLVRPERRECGVQDMGTMKVGGRKGGTEAVGGEALNLYAPRDQSAMFTREGWLTGREESK